eukprot:scaffold31791_cov19-Tisochrysis_lutea.AAC.2
MVPDSTIVGYRALYDRKGRSGIQQARACLPGTCAYTCLERAYTVGYSLRAVRRKLKHLHHSM